MTDLALARRLVSRYLAARRLDRAGITLAVEGPALTLLGKGPGKWRVHIKHQRLRGWVVFCRSSSRAYPTLWLALRGATSLLINPIGTP